MEATCTTGDAVGPRIAANARNIHGGGVSGNGIGGGKSDSTRTAPGIQSRAMGKRGVALRLSGVVAALWAGLLLTIALVATPVPFAVLERAAAGQVVAIVFMIEGYASIAFAVLLFGFERIRARRAAELGVGSVLSANMVLLLAALFCTVFGYFAIQPMMTQARLGQGAWSFGALHAASTVMFGLKTVIVLALAWRLTAR